MAFDLMELARQQAEEGRNYNNAFVGTGQIGAPGTTGSEGGASSIYDPNAALPAVDWNGPAAYGMSPVGAEFGPGNEAAMYAALARAQQFDPTASLVQGMRTTGGEGGGIDQTYYTLNYDPSKVPQPVHPGAAAVGNYGSNESVYDENRLFYDPNYGVMTDPRNLKGDQGFDWLGVLGPAAVGGFAWGIPMLAGAMSAGALGGAAGSFSAPWQINAGMSTAKQVGSGQFSPFGTVAAFAPGIADLGSAPVDNWNLMGNPGAYGLPSDNWDVMGNSGAYGLPTSTELNYGNVARSVGSGARAAEMLYGQQRSYDPQRYGKFNPQRNSQINPDNQPVANSFSNSGYYYGPGKGQ